MNSTPCIRSALFLLRPIPLARHIALGFSLLGVACSAEDGADETDDSWFEFQRSEPSDPETEAGEPADHFTIRAENDHSYRITIWYYDPELEPMCDAGGPCSVPGAATGPAKCGRISDADAAAIGGLCDPALLRIYRTDSFDLAEDIDYSVVPTAYLIIGGGVEFLQFRGDMEHQPATVTLLEELTRLQRHYFDVGDFCSEEDARLAEQGGWPSP